MLDSLKAQGGNGYYALLKFIFTGNYNTTEEALTDVADFNKTKSPANQLKLVSFQDGVATSVSTHYGIVITELPQHFSSSIKARHEELMNNGISVVTGDGLDIPLGAAAVAKTSNTFEVGRSSGIIFVQPKMFSQIILNHEIQHIYDMVLKTDAFFEELPNLPPKIAAIIDKSIRNEPLSWIEKQREHSAMNYPRIWAEAKASEQSIRSFFSIKGFKEMLLPKGRSMEMYFAWLEVMNYSFRNLQLFYHQMWIDPTNPRSVVFVFKSGASGYVFVKAVGLATQGALYSIVYASSLTGIL